jgi:hypothetical protein
MISVTDPAQITQFPASKTFLLESFRNRNNGVNNQTDKRWHYFELNPAN